MARRPKPTAVKLAEGERKDRINMNEPKAIPPRSGPPKHLDDIGLEALKGIREVLSEMKVLTEQDRYLTELYAQIYSDYRRHLVYANNFWVTKAKEQREGKVTFEKFPANSDLHRLRDQMIKILIECGLTPVARQAIVVDDIPTEDSVMRSNDIDWSVDGWTPEELEPPKE